MPSAPDRDRPRSFLPPNLGRRFRLPTCALCRKPVDRLVIEHRSLDADEAIVLLVRCHGSCERVTISRNELEAAADLHLRWASDEDVGPLEKPPLSRRS